MASYEIPLIAASQSLSISLAGVTYQLTILWRNVDQGGWFMDISDRNDVPILQGIPLVTGADLLEQYSYLNFGGVLYVYSDANAFDTPTFDNLGTDSHLYFVTG